MSLKCRKTVTANLEFNKRLKKKKKILQKGRQIKDLL